MNLNTFVFMKKLSILLFYIFFIGIFGQSKITVLKAGERTPIPNASVFCNDKILGKTNVNGVLEFKTKCKKVDVRASDFYEADVVVDQVMEITLAKTDPKVQDCAV